MLLFLNITDAKTQEFTVMFYNTENLFDAEDDTLKDDAEFLPAGTRRWTYNRYWKKLDAISRVIVAAGGWEYPLLVGLCEVENSGVAHDLVSRPLLVNSGYKVVHRESPDTRGIDLCLLYRSDEVSVKDIRSWIPVSSESDPFTSRNMLYVKTTVYGDTVHIILCHWPSRRGGTLAAGKTRESLQLLLASKVDSLIADRGKSTPILIMGDFNTLPDDPLLTDLVNRNTMVNTATDSWEKNEGSYRYRGTWEMIDQILVSSEMTDTTAAFSTSPRRFIVFSAPFLLEDDPDYPGKRPLSTFRGFSWSDGYSDHLPVLLRLHHR